MWKSWCWGTMLHQKIKGIRRLYPNQLVNTNSLLFIIPQKWENAHLPSWINCTRDSHKCKLPCEVLTWDSHKCKVPCEVPTAMPQNMVKLYVLFWIVACISLLLLFISLKFMQPFSTAHVHAEVIYTAPQPTQKSRWQTSVETQTKGDVHHLEKQFSQVSNQQWLPSQAKETAIQHKQNVNSQHPNLPQFIYIHMHYNFTSFSTRNTLRKRSLLVYLKPISLQNPKIWTSRQVYSHMIIMWTQKTL